MAPTTDFCGSVGGCDLYLPSGFTITTESLSGELNIQFNVVTIVSGAKFQLGASGLTAGFRFKFPVTLNGYGTIEDVTGGTGGIFIPLKSNFNFFAGGQFSSTVATFLRVFDTTTGLTVGDGLSLSASLSGPFFVGVSSDGEVSTSTTSNRLLSFPFLLFVFHFCF